MRIILFLLIIFSIAGEKVIIVTQEDVYNDYIKFLNGRSPVEIEYYGGEYSRRDVIEVLMIFKALYLGGMKTFDYEFIFSPTDKRDLAYLVRGEATIRGTTIWEYELNDYENDLYKSIDVIENGTFEAGFYTNEENNLLNRKIGGVEEIKNLRVVSSKFWPVDWISLEKSGFINIYDGSKWENMLLHVINNRADILLAPFQPTDDLSFQVNGIKFFPIIGYKIKLEGTRHFVISSKNSYGGEVNIYLKRGLSKMKEEGIIEKMYRESGFYNEKVKDWIVVY